MHSSALDVPFKIPATLVDVLNTILFLMDRDNCDLRSNPLKSFLHAAVLNSLTLYPSFLKRESADSAESHPVISQRVLLLSAVCIYNLGVMELFLGMLYWYPAPSVS